MRIRYQTDIITGYIYQTTQTTQIKSARVKYEIYFNLRKLFVYLN